MEATSPAFHQIDPGILSLTVTHAKMAASGAQPLFVGLALGVGACTAFCATSVLAAWSRTSDMVFCCALARPLVATVFMSHTVLCIPPATLTAPTVASCFTGSRAGYLLCFPSAALCTNSGCDGFISEIGVSSTCAGVKGTRPQRQLLPRQAPRDQLLRAAHMMRWSGRMRRGYEGAQRLRVARHAL